MRNILLPAIISLLLGCGGAEKDKAPDSPAPLQDSLVDVLIEAPAAATMNREVEAEMEFIAYNDDGDNYQLMARNLDSTYAFVNNEVADRSFNRGDVIRITWKQDTIRMAGDEALQELAPCITALRKVRDGRVSAFRKSYGKSLKYTWPQTEDYSQYYLDKIYLLVEYYLASTKNTLLRHCVSGKELIRYSIEQQTREQKDYVMIGIACGDGQSGPVQWLYIDQDNDRLYEYDLAADVLIPFDEGPSGPLL